MAGYDYDRRFLFVVATPQHFQSVEARHRDIQQDNIDLLPVQHVEA